MKGDAMQEAQDLVIDHLADLAVEVLALAVLPEPRTLSDTTSVLADAAVAVPDDPHVVAAVMAVLVDRRHGKAPHVWSTWTRWFPPGHGLTTDEIYAAAIDDARKDTA